MSTSPSHPLKAGMLVAYLPQPDWGVGDLLELVDEGDRAWVAFPGRSEPTLVTTRGGALVHVELAASDPAMTDEGRLVEVVDSRLTGRGTRRYRVRQDGEEREVDERSLHALPPPSDVLSILSRGGGAPAAAFDLRRSALELDAERRDDALGALLASRVMPLPYQIAVVERVLRARRPRFVLADEVGLGKTIEAGMIFSALRLTGLARRVLVVAPSHLTVQWLVELFHKFNHLFTLMDRGRYAAAQEENPERSPWAQFDLVVTSLELLSRNPVHQAEIAAPDAAWDLVIFDEAHHLKGARAFEVAQAVAANAWGLLLLTATPMQLDPEEYHRLLQLVDPAGAPDLATFEARLARQATLADAVRALESGTSPDAALGRLRALFPEDAVLAGGLSTGEALEHLAEHYSLSEHLIRNRRVIVGGFTPRRLHRHPVAVDPAESEHRQAALRRLRESPEAPRGAVLAGLLRRLESSPTAFAEAVRKTRGLADFAETLDLPRRDAKSAAFVTLLGELQRRERDAKVLVFTESRATLRHLVRLCQDAGVPAVSYHGELTLVERDRRVARFRDPDGPGVLLSTEVGGEGRNFQFAHHLICYDLPWSPAVVEQRIGRLDRIGQTRPVDIHVFETPGTFGAFALELFAESIGVFAESVGGLDAVLEEVEPRLVELALAEPEDREAYRAELRERVTAAREEMRHAWDPLLDRRSGSREEVTALVRRSVERLGMGDDLSDESLEDQLWGVARDLDERLEEVVCDLARRLGFGVDTDEQVDAFECAFHVGHRLNVDALPGIDIREERTILGTFWRDTAVEREEIDYFTTGHPLVEALFAFLRDGPYGRASFRRVSAPRGVRRRGVELCFQVVPPEASDTAPGARVPSRHLARFIDRWMIAIPVVVDDDGRLDVDLGLRRHLEEPGETLRGRELDRAFPDLSRLVRPAAELGWAAAEAALGVLIEEATVAIVEEREQSLERLTIALGHQGVTGRRLQGRLAAESAHYERVLDALAGLSLSLDSAAGFVLSP